MGLFRLVVAALGLLATPAVGVQVTFNDCLTDDYKKSGGLQFTPLYVDTKFDTTNPDHMFTMTVWGNVSGSTNNVDLPAWNSSQWSDDSATAGKILNQAGSSRNTITNLKTNINVLTYLPFHNASAFCSEIEGGSCPLAPVFNYNQLTLPKGLPYFSVEWPFNASYAFTTLTPTFMIINSDEAGTQIGCISANATPSLGNLGWLLTLLPLLILVFVAIVNIFAAVFCPWGTTDIFKWSSNHSRENPDLIRLVTPTFADCLQYYQFIVLTSSLSLDYPGFYQPMASRAAWSTLLFNTSFVSNEPSWQSLVDGVYVTNSTQGLGAVGQQVGLPTPQDLWACLMVWLMVTVACILLLFQLGFLLRRMYRFFANIPKEDLRKKNLPFSIGNVVRIIFNYFLLPIVSLSIFQLSISGPSPTFLTVLASLTLVALIGVSAWQLWVIQTTVPRSDLFDVLPTLLLYGPLYNTYADDKQPFVLVHIALTFLRGIAIGGAQNSGVAQIAILCFSESLMLIAIVFYRPYDRVTSMNLNSGICTCVRLLTILLMVAFAPTLGITEGPKGWVGYVILFIHACMLFLNFFLHALITLIEVTARLSGAGGHTTGGLSKIFGPRQLQRRLPHQRHSARSKQSHLSQIAMIEADTNRPGYYVPSGHGRNESAGSLPGLMRHNRSSSGLDYADFASPVSTRNFDSANSSIGPTTPGEATTFSFIQSNGSRPTAVMAPQPFYRPPRTTRHSDTWNTMASETRRGSIRGSRRASVIPNAELIDLEADRSATPTPYAINLAPRADYSTREVDLYYNQGSRGPALTRGPALNAERPGRRLGTGPADPNGPVATATGWFRSLFKGSKMKEKGKGFEVVRSHRLPPEIRAAMEADPPPDGVPVATTSHNRQGPIESDDDEPKPKDWTVSKGGLESPTHGESSKAEISGLRVDDEAAADGERTPLSSGMALPPHRQSLSISDEEDITITQSNFGDVSMIGAPTTAPVISHPNALTPMPFLRTTSDTSTNMTPTRNNSISSTFMLGSNSGSMRSIHGSVPSHSVVLDNVLTSASLQGPWSFDMEAQEVEFENGTISRRESNFHG